MIDEFKLIAETIQRDNYGNEYAQESETEFVSEIYSVMSNEFFKAGQSGLRPQFMVRISVDDYSAERIIEYKGERYSIYRTYVKGDEIELYAGTKVGV